MSTNEVLSGYDLTNVVMKVETTVQGRLSNSNTSTFFRHENWFRPIPLSQAKLVDPGLTLSYSNSTKNFTVQATTGVAAWVWLVGMAMMREMASNAVNAWPAILFQRAEMTGILIHIMSRKKGIKTRWLHLLFTFSQSQSQRLEA
ncbi:hypothetical protein B0A49_08659 [Cryomyces minteri]|uniref:Uncharacterized protein n=1 Tax=Cryomyces minteri TaxID=331657 RepID=A0A4U0XEG1_9PEZI|nr:hypothetical protein B0A49_08659 [Cryomyces minteri]